MIDTYKAREVITKIEQISPALDRVSAFDLECLAPQVAGMLKQALAELETLKIEQAKMPRTSSKGTTSYGSLDAALVRLLKRSRVPMQLTDIAVACAHRENMCEASWDLVQMISARYDARSIIGHRLTSLSDRGLVQYRRAKPRGWVAV